MKSLFAFIAFLPLVACARPNYQNISPLDSNTKAASCSLYFTTENLCASYDWVKKPTEDDTGSFNLKFWNRDTGVATDPKMTLKVVIWMPDMGHGSSPVTITQQSAGAYFVDRVYFSMHGAWQIRFQLKNAQAVAEEQVANVTF